MWKGDTFRVPATTIQRPKEQGGWALQDIAVKNRTLLPSRKWIFGAREESLTEARIQQWQLTGALAKPPYGNSIRSRIAYLKHAIDMAYINPQSNTESRKIFKKRLYGMLHAMNTVIREIPDLCVTQEHPSIPWERKWRNIHHVAISENLKSTWYAVIREICPHERAISSNKLDWHRPLHSLRKTRLTATQNHRLWRRPCN